MWRVGDATEPVDSDPYYKQESVAIEAARSMAKGRFYTPIAVWDERCNIVHLFLCDQQFKSV